MEYDNTLAQAAYTLAEKWDTSRIKDVSSLDFKKTDLDSFDSNQKGDSDHEHEFCSSLLIFCCLNQSFSLSVSSPIPHYHPRT